MNPPSRFQTPRKLARMCVLGIFLGSVFCASAHAQTALQPTQVLDLYLKVLVNRDIRSATEINDYMRPFDGQNVFNLQAILEMEDPPASVQNAHERLFLKTLLATVRRSGCLSVASAFEQDAATGNRVALVNYVCHIPDARIASLLADFENEASDSAKAERMAKIVATLEGAAVDKQISGSLRLQEVKAGDKSWWRPVSVGDTLNRVLENLLSE
ncbi:MAG: hypothetical protein LBU53_02625 [Zoogloeaceae bacterium]|jgi:hypothetical protein|nr:hypothetical protein [Zoogloeaceae bacterium]